MEKPIRMEKRVVSIGNSKGVILPMFFIGDNCEKVILEIYKNHAVVLPVRK